MVASLPDPKDTIMSNTLQTLIAQISNMQDLGFSPEELLPLKKKALELAGKMPASQPSEHSAPKKRLCIDCEEPIKGRLPKDSKLARLCGDCRRAASKPSASPAKPASKPAKDSIRVKTLDQVKASVKAEAPKVLGEPTKIVESKVKADFVQTSYGVKLSVAKPNGRWLSKGRMRALSKALRAQFGPGYEVLSGDEVPEEERGMYVPSDSDDLKKVVGIVSTWAEPFKFEKDSDVIQVNTTVDWS
jgi:tRNA A37 threonylcarbamoyladenosine synthetase subunit TsaC/SUA5/YrdC